MVGPLAVVAFAIAAIGLLGAPGTTSAVTGDGCAVESEPNDVGDAALTLHVPGCVTGSLPDGDPADLWAWTITDDDARRLWTLSLEGVPGTISAVQLVPITSEPGVSPMTYIGKAYELDAPADAQEPAVDHDVLLPPGRYLLAVGRTALVDGGTLASDSYRVTIASSPLPPSADAEPNDQPVHATPVGGAFEASGQLTDSPDYLAWTLSEADAAHSWDVGVQAPPGHGLGLTLADRDGAALAVAQPDTVGRAWLHDLHLPAGTVLLQPTGGPATWVMRAVPSDVPGADPEPNDTPRGAVPIVPGTTQPGRIAADGDRDLYRLTVDAALAGQLVDIRLLSRDGPERELCLYRTDSPDAVGTTLACVRGTGGTALRSLVLPEGEVLVGVGGPAGPAAPYLVRIDAVGAPAADFEQEPNGDATTATAFPATVVMRGHLIAGDTDEFRVHTDGAPQLWRLEATGAHLEHVQLMGPDGTVLKDGAVSVGDERAVLDDLYLVPGDHLVRVLGSDTDYRISLSSLGPPDPLSELEPNDDAVRAEPLPIGGMRTGRLADEWDHDSFRFSLAAPERIGIRIQPPTDGAVSMWLGRDSQRIALVAGRAAGQGIDYDAQLPPGDYLLVLGADTLSDGRYELRLEREDPLATVDDQEPNDAIAWARPVPADGVASGDAIVRDDPDWYRLGPLAAPGSLQVRTAGAVFDVTLWDEAGNAYPLARASDADPLAATGLPVGVPLDLQVLAEGSYTLAVGDPAPEPVRTAAEPLGVRLSLELDADAVAAYWTASQAVHGTLHLAGGDAAPEDVTLDAVTSHAAWSVELASADVALGPGVTADVPVTVRALPDAWAGVPVRVTVRARDGDGHATTAFAEVTPTIESPPADPGPGWALPDALLGGLDAASTALGGVPVPSVNADAEALLHDGVTPLGGGSDVRIGSLPVALTVDLAGDAPVPIAGTILDPLADASTLTGIPRAFTLLLSTDGTTWEPALTGELQPLPVEQAFVLQAPVAASFAQLRVESTWGGNAGELVLGEWQVVTTPGSGTEAILGTDAPNVADPTRGGHVVWMEPASGDQGFPAVMLDEDASRRTMFLPAHTRPTWVMGFAQDRAAALTRLEWVDPVGSDPASRLRTVQVDVSLHGPLGPWRPLGTWELRRAADGSVAPLTFDAPTWARFLRFQGEAHRQDLQLELPATLRAIERPVGDGFRSVLGQWGGEGPDGPLEWTEPPDRSTPPDDPDPADAPDAARPLTLGEPVRGLVAIDRDVDWYGLTAPVDAHSITISVGGVPSVRVRATLFDAAGSPVAMSPGPAQASGAQTFTAPVEGGATYRVRIEQAPFSAVVAFDTSGSLGPYLTYIQLALRSYARGIVPGAEAVHVQPFEEPTLLPGWTDDPYLLENAAALYTPVAGSSAMETGVIDALGLLEGREGSRAILLMTDAETTSYFRNAEMWRGLDALRPSLFTLLVAGTGTPAADRRTMQDLALTSGGGYHYASSQAEVDRALDRVAAWLRRPAAYSLTVEPSERVVPPPEPGRLAVVAPGVPDDPSRISVAKDAAVEIILDTSGSMLDKVGKRRRIDIATDVLTDLVERRLPAGVPFALRVFGDRADVCGTRLAVPLAPLDAGAVTRLVRGIDVVRAADTPIGDAIASVAADLAGPARTRIVLLITDAEEVWPHPDLCGRDPAEAIAALARQGITVRLNIVGFGLSAKRAKAQMRRWAELGGGAYFDAHDQRQLAARIADAIRAPFQVLDASGTVVATGTVGGPAVTLPPGTYSVVVLTDPEVRFDAVLVSSGETAQLTLR
jgi:hypothetical protein